VISKNGSTRLFARVAIVVAPAGALILFASANNSDLPEPALAVGCVGIVMAVWWMTEAIPLPVTALLPLVLFPLLGVASIETTASAYAHPLIFLFFGGFLLAQAMQRWDLNRHVAKFILRFAGDRPAGVIAGVMAATAFLSMWVSNTATAMMMLPIGQSVINARQWLPAPPGAPRNRPGTALMLGIAYAATIGGMGTLIGTPPNAIFAGYLSEAYGIEVSFTRWMLVGIPAVAILLPIAWLVLTRIAFSLPSGGTVPSYEMAGENEPLSKGGWRTAIILGAAATAWTFRPLLETVLPKLNLSDAGIALAAAIALFIVPADRPGGGGLLSWNDAKKIRWDVLILFGGGLALADALNSSGLADWIGGKTIGLEVLPFLVLLILLSAIIVAVGELASNTAMAAVFLPIAAAIGLSLGADPLDFALPVALAASLGFILPVATPPNAIVYGSGSVSVQDMLRAGILLDLIGIFVVSLLAVTIGRLVFNGL
jgi:sodium-dependent dicarboxylate transporter 2/3/5